ncbi:DUF3592 domain-containing protein [Streptomyces sp. NPDC049099]|uniref:DUF3592 domain-containing protein n=1 Tax=Streptomyces sp. NPDC049099 TaxID=3155768 RepID=UPI00342C6186
MTHAEAALLTEGVMVMMVVVSFFLAVPHFWNERLRRRGVKGRGVCISHSVRDGKVSCLIRFRIPDGDSITFNTPRSSQASAEVRERVDVIYDPRKPKRAVIAYTLPKDGTPVRRFLIGMAVVFVVTLGIRICLAI